MINAVIAGVEGSYREILVIVHGESVSCRTLMWLTVSTSRAEITSNAIVSNTLSRADL